MGSRTSGALISAAGLTIAGVNVVGAISTGLVIGALYGAERLLASPRGGKPQLQLPAGPVAQEIELAAVSARYYTYGQDRVGGAVFFQEVGGQLGGWLGYGIVLSCRPIDGVVTYFVDDEAWSISTGLANEPVESPAGYAPQAVDLGPEVFWPNAGPKFTVFSILVYVPGQGPQPSPTGSGPIMFGEFRNALQAGALSTLLTRDHASIWDNTHLGRGLACLYFRANRMDREYRFVRYPRGFPTVSTVLRGQRLFDPRDNGQSFYAAGAHLTAVNAIKAGDAAFYTGGDFREDTGGIWSAYNPTWEYSSNPALQIADLLTCPAGFDLTYDDLDWPSFVEAANDCDRLCPIFPSGTGAFATAHLTWSAAEERRDVLGKLLAACDAQIYEDEDGKVAIWVGKWIEPTVTLTEADLAMPITFDGSSGVYEGDNVVTPAYVEPRSNYQRNTSLFVEDAASIARVGRRSTTIDLPAVKDFNQAYRLAARALRRKNSPMKIGLCRRAARIARGWRARRAARAAELQHFRRLSRHAARGAIDLDGRAHSAPSHRRHVRGRRPALRSDQWRASRRAGHDALHAARAWRAIAVIFRCRQCGDHRGERLCARRRRHGFGRALSVSRRRPCHKRAARRWVFRHLLEFHRPV